MRLFSFWRPRHPKPTFKAGDDVEGRLTAVDPETGRGQARVDGTVLVVDDADPSQLDQPVQLHIEYFNEQEGTGTAWLRRATQIEHRILETAD